MPRDGKRKRSGLRREAERLQRLMEEASRISSGASTGRKMLTFRLEDRLFAMPLDALDEVLSPPTLHRVPMARKALLGMAGIRGEVVPILDLRQLLGLAPSPAPGEGARVLIVGQRSERAGFLVDGVAEVESWSEKDLQPPEESGGFPLLGIVNVRGTQIALLDLPALMARLRTE